MPDSSLDFRDRAGRFSALEDRVFDLLVIGAGITGAGIARDAAMRGLSVALVDAKDIAAGTSSRSSKLIHGGMRYLAEGHINIVREAARERKVLRRIAPHLAQTTRLVVPCRTRRSILKFKTGMLAYERLGQVEKSERHEIWDVERLAQEEPEVRTEGLRGAVAYPEYVTDDARLTLANVRSAAAHGAVVATYAAIEEILVENGRACGAVAHDALGGDYRARIRARLVVNAAGPWMDAVRALEDCHAPARLQLTKGIHVALSRKRLPIRNTVIMDTPDKRLIFVVPRGRFVYFGTTDTFYPKTEYWPEITREDIAYLLDVGSATFRCGPFGEEDIVSLWSGVRPLLAQEGKGPSEISRRNETLEGPAGVLSIAGGKLTSYRSMAKRIVDACEEKLGRGRTPSSTDEEPLPGGDFAGSVEELATKLLGQGLDSDEAERAARLFGSEAAQVYGEGAGVADEVRWSVLHEGALTLEDYWARRSARAHFDDEGGLASLEPASETMAELLGWSEDERLKQVEACRAIRRNEMQAIGAKEAEVGHVNR